MGLMSWKAHNQIEYRILENFSERLGGNDEISSSVKNKILTSLEETTISQNSEADEITEEIIEEEENASE